MVNNTYDVEKHNTVFTSQHDSLPSLVAETNFVTGSSFSNCSIILEHPRLVINDKNVWKAGSFLSHSNRSAHTLTLLTFWLSHAQIFNKDLANNLLFMFSITAINRINK
jgi:hypothetical protein